jgi:NAD+ kinase
MPRSTSSSGAKPARPRAVRRVLVVADHDKAGVREFERELLPWLEARGLQLALEGDARELARRGAPAERPDLCVVLGGDGAILGAVRAFAQAPVPTLGINFGRVGFLASVPSGQWRDALEEVLAGRGIVEPRMRLEARLASGTHQLSAVALNDAVVARGATQGMLTLSFSVDGSWMTDYRADGLILATASGSTAHSLSAGGPVLYPTMEAIVVTPICPQGLAYRPIVLHPSSRIEVGVRATSGLVTLALDGQGFLPVRQGERVIVTRHPEPYPLLTWSGLDPYRRLRERLGWSGVTEPELATGDDDMRHSDAGHGGVL